MTKKILLINDIPGYGKVAIPAMTPILVKKGFEVYNLPTTVLSNTLNYGKFASIDTTEYMKEAVRVWKELGFKFDAVAIGFIANEEQGEFIANFAKEQASEGAVILADPIMGDNGKLYNSVNLRRVEIMRRIIAHADYIVPNMTEACALSDIPYREEGFSKDDLYKMAESLHEIGAKSILITSAFELCENGNVKKTVVGYDNVKNSYFTVDYDEIPLKINGSGDIFSAVILSETMSETGLEEATRKGVYVLREMILRNKDEASDYNGLPVEANLDLF